VVRFTPRPLYPQGKTPSPPWYPLDRRPGGTQNRSESGGEEKSPQPLPGLEPPLIQPVSQRCTAELSSIQKPESVCSQRAGMAQEIEKTCYELEDVGLILGSNRTYSTPQRPALHPTQRPTIIGAYSPGRCTRFVSKSFRTESITK
jgi:hypothetical protein